MVHATKKRILRNVARNLKRLRGDRSQRSVAKAAKIQPMTVHRLEAHVSLADVASLASIATVLEVTVDELIS